MRIFILTFISALLLSSCTIISIDNDECGYKWIQSNDPIPESSWSYIEVSDIELYCNNDDQALSCARQWRGPSPYCEIYTSSTILATEFCHSPEYLKRHEGLHCKGYIHPGSELSW